MRKYLLTSLTATALISACSSNSGTQNAHSNNDSTNVAVAPKPALSLQEQLLGTWTGNKDHEVDTMTIEKDSIRDIGEDTKLKYSLRGDSIIIKAGSLGDKGDVYKAKVTIQGNKMTFSNSEGSDELNRIK